jgi:hypothetical protein
MRKIKLVPILLALSCLFVTGCFGHDFPKPGEIWLYCQHQENPFKDKVCETYKVLDVKEGYVQFQEIGSDRVESSKISWFVIGSTKLPTAKR